MVTSADNNLPEFASSEWHTMFGNSTYQYVIDIAEEDTSTSDATETLQSGRKSDKIGLFQEKHLHATPLSVSEPATQPLPTSLLAEGGGSTQTSYKQVVTPTIISNPPFDEVQPENIKDIPNIPLQATNVQLPERKPSSSHQRKYKPEPATRRSRRTSKPSEQLTYSHGKKSFTHINTLMTDQLEVDKSFLNCHQISDAIVLLTSKAQSNPDLFDYSDAMNGEHRAEWIKSASKEILVLKNLITGRKSQWKKQHIRYFLEPGSLESKEPRTDCSRSLKQDTVFEVICKKGSLRCTHQLSNSAQ